MEGQRVHILLWSITKHGPPHAILVSDWPIFKNLLWNRLAKLTETWQEASMECPLWRLFISSRSVNKHGHHRQFLFLIGRYLKSPPLKLPSQMNRNLVGSIYMYMFGRFCIKFPQSRMKGERHRLKPTEPLSVKNVGKTWEDDVVVIVILWKLDLQLPVQSVPIAT